MKKLLLTASAVFALSFALPAVTLIAGATGATSFTYTGAVQTYLVPAGVTSINVVATGGSGQADDSSYYQNGNNNSGGGAGASVTSTSLPVSPGDTLDVYVGQVGQARGVGGWGFGDGGQGGTDRGGSQFGGGGGGGTAITDGATLLLVAGGGGGGGQYNGVGGSGAASNTAAGGTGGFYEYGGAPSGGTGALGGTNGTGGTAANAGFVLYAGTSGASYINDTAGANGGAGANCPNNGSGNLIGSGGGGGGYGGGGGGSAPFSSCDGDSGGGAGGSYSLTTATFMADATGLGSDGAVAITANIAAPPTATAPSAPGGLSLSAGVDSLSATWNSSAGATDYTCTLMYGFNDPSLFSVTTSATTCSFAGLATTVYGIEVVAINAGGPSSSVVAFATTLAPTPPTKHRTIVCVRHGKVKRVTGANPRCPAGYKKR